MERAVLSEIIHITGNQPISFSLNKLTNNTVATGTVNKVIFEVKKGMILFNFDPTKTLTELLSFKATKGKVITIDGTDDILNFRAIPFGDDNKACIYVTYYK